MAAVIEGRGAAERSGGARRAWLAGLLVWTLVLQLLVPALGPLRLGDGTATAGLGRLLPICTIDGLRLADPAPAGEEQPTRATHDAGWHCLLCVTPALPATAAAAVAAPVAWHFAWTISLPRYARLARAWSPLTARGPPTLS